jgi:hypothetical protein
MKKKQRCKKCGGAFTYIIPDSAFQGESRFILHCPFCQEAVKLVIEDGYLISEESASFPVTNLPQKRISTEMWFEILKDLSS